MLKRLYHKLVDSATRQLRQENAEVLAHLTHIENKVNNLAENIVRIAEKQNELLEQVIKIEDREKELVERATHIEGKENELIERTIHIEDKQNELIDRVIHIEDKENELKERAIHIKDKENNFMRDMLIQKENLEVYTRCLSQQLSNIEFSLPMKKRVHFIRSIDIYNMGDMNCCPFDYFPQFRENFSCYLHTIKNVDYSLIHSGDFVIIGGGGMFECNENYQNTIIRLLSMPVKVIAWGVGHNLHDKDSIYYNDKINEIDYSKFFLLTTRDYDFKEQRFLPCVSCMSPLLDMKLPLKREIGIIEHHDIPISEFDFEKISNSEPIEKVIEFIATSDSIITNTYHCAYFATLMKKRVILYKPFSSRFEYFKYKPIVYSGNLAVDIEKSEIFPSALEEFRRLEHSFANEIIEIIEGE